MGRPRRASELAATAARREGLRALAPSILALVQDEPITSSEIATRLGLDVTRVGLVIRDAMAAKQVRFAGLTNSGRTVQYVRQLHLSVEPVGHMVPAGGCERRADCARYAECLGSFVRRHLESDDAQCPIWCGDYVRIDPTRERDHNAWGRAQSDARWPDMGGM